MTRRLLTAALGCLVLGAAFALPGTARAEATIAHVDLPAANERTPAVSAARRFTLAAVHWQGAGRVTFRVRGLGGRWSGWLDAMPEAEDRPDRDSPEARARDAWRTGNPYWVGPADRVEVRRHGDVRRVRAWLVWSPETRVPLRRLAVAGSPPIVPRAAWAADESIVRSKPGYASAIRLAVVHHTAGRNTYTRAEAAAVVKAIQLYHVKGNGWNDIGYNFLVDRYGTVYEGRAGGIDRNVVGAHAQGFNTGSVGIALLGTYTGSAPTKAAEDALAQLAAWRLDVAHVDPLSTLQYLSNGNPRFAEGIPVFLRAVSGHRDTGFTTCPGDTLYARLAALAGAVSRVGLPKLYEPLVTGQVGGLVSFKARLSAALPWTVTVADELGIEAARWTGTGPVVDWTWDATLAAPGGYTWRIDGGPGMTPATGTLGSTVVSGPLAITSPVLDSETVSPNEDGQADRTTLTFSLTAPATVTVDALDEGGTPVAQLVPPARRPAGETALELDPAPLADGRYQLLLTARDAAGVSVTQLVPLAVSRTLGSVALAPAAFSPNADGRADRLTIRFALAAGADVKVRVLRDGKWIATPFAGALPAGQRRVAWDGAKRVGRLLDGSYVAVVEATDAIGTSRVELPFASDTRAPAVRFLRGLPVRVSVSEPARLTLLVNGRPSALSVAAAGEVTVAPRGRVRVVAWDAAGNRSAPLRRP